MSEAFSPLKLTGFEAVSVKPKQSPAAAYETHASKHILVERADAGRLATIETAWRDLVTRALEPNVFMDPGLLLAAMTGGPARKFAILLAWYVDKSNARLVGVWGAVVGVGLLPLPLLRTPASPHSYLGTPVLDRDLAEIALSAMLDTVAEAPDLPKILSVAPMRADGPTMPLLRRVQQTRQADLHVFTQSQRPLLQSDLSGNAYLSKAMSSSSRKKLRQHRRRLAERGALTQHSFTTPADTSSALERFLALEAAGWKGRCKTALNCSRSDAAFTRNMIADLSTRGDVGIYALHLDGKPVSMQIVLRCGDAAFTWKTTYDEDFRDVSPGMLQLEDSTAALLADPAIRIADSCAFDENSFMAVWQERETLATLWIDARRGGSPGFAARARMETALLNTRNFLKRSYKTGMKTWMKSKP